MSVDASFDARACRSSVSIDAGSSDAANDAADAHSNVDAAFPGMTPTQVQPASLQLWLSADQGVTSSGTAEPFAVSAWGDQSGHARNATQATAGKQPLLHTTTPLPGTTSSEPWIEITPGATDGTADGLMMNVDLSFLASSSYTIIAVVARTGTKGENYFIGTHFGGPSSNDEALHVGWSDDTDFYLGQFGDDLGATVVANTDAGSQPVLASTLLDTTVGHTIFLNGTQAATNASLTPLSLADQGALGRGYGTTPDNDYFQGGIGEIVIYSVALSAADRAQVELYLKSKWQTP